MSETTVVSNPLYYDDEEPGDPEPLEKGCCYCFSLFFIWFQ